MSTGCLTNLGHPFVMQLFCHLMTLDVCCFTTDNSMFANLKMEVLLFQYIYDRESRIYFFMYACWYAFLQGRNIWGDCGTSILWLWWREKRALHFWALCHGPRPPTTPKEHQTTPAKQKHSGKLDNGPFYTEIQPKFVEEDGWAQRQWNATPVHIQIICWHC